jgi:hypothetical protein
VLSEVYRNGMQGPLSGLPAAARDVASESLASTYAVAANSGRAGAALIAPANDAFVNAMHWAAGGSAIAGLLGALAVLKWLPGRTAPEVEPVPLAQVEASFVDAT